MSDKSAIEWTDATWNPVTGCTKVSPACANCYIERQTPLRIAGRKFVKGHIPLEFHEHRLDAPLRRRTPTVYFVNSMSDLFHEDVPDAFIDKVFAVMALAPRHTFQVLTKRAERMRAFLSANQDELLERWAAASMEQELPLDDEARDGIRAGADRDEQTTWQSERAWSEIRNTETWPLPNVWLGVSVENQRFADERIPLLLQTPAAVRFISAEPLLEAIDLRRYLGGNQEDSEQGERADESRASDGLRADPARHEAPRVQPNAEPPQRLSWVIVGGESGPRLRPTNPAWVRGIRDQCVAAGVPFFFKQWGGRTPKSGGRELDGRTWDEMPMRHDEDRRNTR